MKLNFGLLLLLPLQLIAAVATTDANEMAKNALLQKIKLEFPKATKIAIEKFYIKQQIPEGAKLEELRPNPPVGVLNFAFSWDTEKGHQQVFGNAVARIFLKVAVTKAPVRHGEYFSESNIKFEERELTPYSHVGYFTEGNEIYSFTSQGNIAPEHVIVTSQTALPQLIKMGQIVDLVYQTPTLKITARSKALKGGREGDRIRVENITSKKIIEGRIISANEVSIK